MEDLRVHPVTSLSMLLAQILRNQNKKKSSFLCTNIEDRLPVVTLFSCITMFCGTAIVQQNIRKCFVEYCQFHKTLLWVWIILWWCLDLFDAKKCFLRIHIPSFHTLHRTMLSLVVCNQLINMNGRPDLMTPKWKKARKFAATFFCELQIRL